MSLAFLDTVEQYCKWLEVNKGRSPLTAKKYHGHLFRLAIWAESKGADPLKLTLSDLDDFTGAYAHAEGFKPSSRRPLVAAVKGFYGWLVRSGVLSENPASEIPYPAFGRKLPNYLKLENAEKLIMTPDVSTFIGIRDAAMIGLFLGCGFRLSGVASLNESQLMFVKHAGRDHLFIRVLEKGDKERDQPVPAEAMLLVQAYLGHADLRSIDRDLANGDRVLFISVRNRKVKPHNYHGEARRITTRSIAKRLEFYGEQAGIPRDELNPHAMRHLYGTELAESDVHLLKMQSLMGHSDPKTTEIYTHLARRGLAAVVEKANPLAKINTPVSGLVRELMKN